MLFGHHLKMIDVGLAVIVSVLQERGHLFHKNSYLWLFHSLALAKQ